MKLGRLNHVGVATPSIEKSLELYRTMFGAEPHGPAFDLPAHDGNGAISADELSRVTASNLDPEFGRVVDTRDFAGRIDLRRGVIIAAIGTRRCDRSGASAATDGLGRLLL